MAEYPAVSVLAFVCVLLATEVESVHRSKMNVGAKGRSQAPTMPMRPYDYSMYFGSFICEVGKERGQVTAISGTKICDGVIDCIDGGDEIGCTICVPDRMKCNNGEKCAVPCDGITECAGGEDENGCKKDACNFCGKGRLACRDGKTCVDAVKICDGRKDCPDNDDEMSCSDECDCPRGTYRCVGGDKCVPANKFCNGVDNCPFGDDEKNCPDSCKCSPGQFKCMFGDCIDKNQLCDETDDCVYGEDEWPKATGAAPTRRRRQDGPMIDFGGICTA